MAKRNSFIKSFALMVAMVMCLLTLSNYSVYAAGLKFNVDDNDQNGVVPTDLFRYGTEVSDYFTVGSTSITAKFWINDHLGGVTFTSSDYCDYYVVDGYILNAWGDRHNFTGTRYETTTCEFYTGCYDSHQPIRTVHVTARICSPDAQDTYDETASLGNQ